MSDDLIAAHRDVEKLAPYLHLPIQSGSDRILASMNRRHRVADYLDIVARTRAARPDIALSSDFIVGYPGETDDDFEATLDLVRAVGFASSYAFKYSAETRNAGRRTGGPGRRGDQGRRGSRGCRRCSKSSGRRSIAPASGGVSRCCSKGPGGTRARSSAVRRTCSGRRSAGPAVADRRDGGRRNR